MLVTGSVIGSMGTTGEIQLRDAFSGYYQPSDEEFRRFWHQGTFVPDANILLNLYRVSRETRAAIIKILSNLRDRLWIPHQFALEFHENRLGVIQQSYDVYQAMLKLPEETRKKVNDQIDNLRRDSVVDVRALREAFDVGFEAIAKKLETVKSGRPLSLRLAIKDDPTLESVTQIFQDRVGPSYDDAQRQAAIAEARRRIEARIPPGYSDAGKGDRALGDGIAWLQVLEWAKGQDTPVIVVTDDQKEDWYRKEGSTIVGPRPELISEMKEVAGVGFYLYSMQSFLKHANSYLEADISEGAIEEAFEADRRERERTQRLHERLEMELGVVRSDLVRLFAVRDQLHGSSTVSEQEIATLSSEVESLKARRQVALNALDHANSQRDQSTEHLEMLRQKFAAVHEEDAAVSSRIAYLSELQAQAKRRTMDLYDVERSIAELEHRRQQLERQIAFMNTR